jgi:hypothetical protein
VGYDFFGQALIASQVMDHHEHNLAYLSGGNHNLVLGGSQSAMNRP